MERGLQGHYKTTTVAGDAAEAFIPLPLPPSPSIQWSKTLRSKYDQALLMTGKLDGVSDLIPNVSIFIYMYIRKEAVLSSQIEGTQSSLSNLLLYELDEKPGVPIDDVEEVSHYVSAMEYGLKRIKEGFPVSLRLLREIHEVLLSQARGSNKNPGEFRRSQNWIGGTKPSEAIYVPPPHHHVQDLLNNLELFLHDQPESTPILVKCALAHIQFETIHPFLDGNGRLGRLLITLLLCSEGVLQSPTLYLSLYFKTHRQRYYELLNEIRLNGDWEKWLEFFADAVIDTAQQAVDTSRRIMKLIAEDKERIAELGRVSGSTIQVYEVLTQKPISSTLTIGEAVDLSPATINKCLNQLEMLGMIEEITGRKRDRVYAYSQYIKVMSEGITVS